jgi:hypothetical protein
MKECVMSLGMFVKLSTGVLVNLTPAPGHLRRVEPEQLTDERPLLALFEGGGHLSLDGDDARRFYDFVEDQSFDLALLDLNPAERQKRLREQDVEGLTASERELRELGWKLEELQRKQQLEQLRGAVAGGGKILQPPPPHLIQP